MLRAVSLGSIYGHGVCLPQINCYKRNNFLLFFLYVNVVLTVYIFLSVGVEGFWLVWWSEATTKEWVYTNRIWFDATWRDCKYNKCNYSILYAVHKCYSKKLVNWFQIEVKYIVLHWNDSFTVSCLSSFVFHSMNYNTVFTCLYISRSSI